MTDNSPATDEEVEAAHKALMAELFLHCQPDRGDVFSFMDDHKNLMRSALNAASRIRAETAKNSGERAATCEKCGGEGTLYTSKYGGNDPDVWPVGTCEECEGTGRCQYAEAVAMPEYRCAGECQYATREQNNGEAIPFIFISEQQIAGMGDSHYIAYRKNAEGLFQFPLYTHPSSSEQISGEAVAWETYDIQIDGSPARTFSKMEADNWIAQGRKISRYFYATPANSRAEAIGARETDSPLLAASYYAMSKAMELLDADLGHGPVLNMLAKCRCDIENRRALLQQEGE